MGTGSFGGGGSGGSGVGSDGGIGAYRFKNGQFISATVSSDTAKKEIQRKLRGLPTEYIKNQFGSPLVRSSYEEIFKLSRCINDENPCEVLSREYMIDEGERFLFRWVDKIMASYQQHEPNSNVRDLVRICLEDFLVRALDNDIDLYLNGTCVQVLAKLNRSVFRSTSGHFLGNMVWRVLEREYEKQQPQVQVQIQQQSQILANQVIHSFEERFLKKKQVTHRDFFRIVQENIGWFVEELKK